MRALDLGDAQVFVAAGPAGGETAPAPAPAWLVERKTQADLVASIKDGRWREQKQRVLANVPLERVVYVVEGAAGFAYDARTRHVPGLTSPAALQSCLLNAQFRDGRAAVAPRDLPAPAPRARCAAGGRRAGGGRPPARGS